MSAQPNGDAAGQPVFASPVDVSLRRIWYLAFVSMPSVCAVQVTSMAAVVAAAAAAVMPLGAGTAVLVPWKAAAAEVSVLSGTHRSSMSCSWLLASPDMTWVKVWRLLPEMSDHPPPEGQLVVVLGLWRIWYLAAVNEEPNVVCGAHVIEISPGNLPPVACGLSGLARPERVFVADAALL